MNVRIQSCRSVSPTWTVATAFRVDNGQRVSLVGDFIAEVGETLSVSGEEVDHPKYGRQFRVQAVVRTVGQGRQGLLAYLDRLPHIGPERARALLTRWTEAEVAGALAAPQDAQLTEMLSGIAGLSSDRVRLAVAEHRRLARVRAALIELEDLQVPAALIEAAVSAWDDQAVARVQADPFDLLVFDAATLDVVQAVARRLGIGPEDLRWQTGTAVWAIRQREREGHTWTPLALMPPCAPEVYASGKLRVEDGHAGGAAAAAEARVAAWLREALLAEEPLEVDPDAIAAAWPKGTPHPDQVRALEMALTHRVSCLTGGPGVGKSATVSALVALLSEHVTVHILAPTGKAARRVTELSGLPASTIHLWLLRGEVEEDACVIIDETSMVSVDLLDQLLAQLSPQASRVIFVGDPDQLPSIGPGRVLADLLESEAVPTTRLTHIFRQASESRIPHFARELNHQRVPQPLDLPASDVRFFQTDPAHLVTGAVQLVNQLIPESRGIPASAVRVISPMRSRGDGAVDALNAAFQQATVARDPEAASRYVELSKGRFACIGEPLMHTKNNYELGVMNGESGTLVDIRGDDIIVRYDDRDVTYSKGTWTELTLAYAVTGHRCQGSSFPAVVVICDRSQSYMLTRAWLYTAVTRAERLCVLVGQADVFARALSNTRDDRRCTRLAAMLR